MCAILVMIVLLHTSYIIFLYCAFCLLIHFWYKFCHKINTETIRSDIAFYLHIAQNSCRLHCTNLAVSAILKDNSSGVYCVNIHAGQSFIKYLPNDQLPLSL